MNSDILRQAKKQARSARTWADLSNAIFDPVDGLIAKAYPTIEARRNFQKSAEYRTLQQLVEGAMRRTGAAPLHGPSPSIIRRWADRPKLSQPTSYSAGAAHSASTASS